MFNTHEVSFLSKPFDKYVCLVSTAYSTSEVMFWRFSALFLELPLCAKSYRQITWLNTISLLNLTKFFPHATKCTLLLLPTRFFVVMNHIEIVSKVFHTLRKWQEIHTSCLFHCMKAVWTFLLESAVQHWSGPVL